MTEFLTMLRNYRGMHLILAALFGAGASSIELVLNHLATGTTTLPEWATPLIPIASLFGYAIASAFKESAKEERMQAVENDAVETNPGGAVAALYRAEPGDTAPAQNPPPSTPTP